VRRMEKELGTDSGLEDISIMEERGKGGKEL
jgi:hypothetical protein